MKETYVKYGKNGLLLINYGDNNEIVYETGILFMKISNISEIIEYKDLFYFDVEYFDIISNFQGKVSVLSNNKQYIIDHMDKIKKYRYDKMIDKLGFE